ncbi:hypothetical protein THAOC_11445, partial [Thalassiosira oceanica]
MAPNRMPTLAFSARSKEVGAPGPSKGVKFSTDVEASASMRSHADSASRDNGYDSDEMEDALASGDALSMNLDGDDV